MSVRWTKEQKQVIDLRNRNILVSAAAGSGKTAVLVERIITMLTQDEDPMDVDQLLVVTFTEAAAAEMKERIRNAIEKKSEACPENEHLKQQATLIHNAQITTIHSFCLSVIREHFHVIDLEPGFRIGEEGELKLLRHDVLKEVLETYYKEGTGKFLDFTESYAGGKDDKKLEELILKLYEFSRSYPDAGAWLTGCIEAYGPKNEAELLQTAYFQSAIENTRRYMDEARELVRQGLMVCREPDGPYMYADTLEADFKNVERFAHARSYTEYYEAAGQVSWVRLAANRDKSVSAEKAAQVKSIRDEVKDIVKDITSQYFFQSIEEVLEDLALCRPMMEVLVSLTEAFASAFEEKKRSQNMIDFSDMEQYALRILTEKTDQGLIPSQAAAEYQEQFREVMIDEYQDSNLIQEAILTSVSGVSKGRENIFMVGDVKQSIYRFRLSRPELFMEKFDSYDVEKDSKRQRIDLHKNFRSRREVLGSVNYLFEQLMTRPLGGIVYDEKAALYVGADYIENKGNETEVILVEKDDDSGTGKTGMDSISIEARAVAGKIRQLMTDQQVVDKETGLLRPVCYKDIVILTRSIKGWSDTFAKVLGEYGIPVFAGTKEGYFETLEIGILLDYLRILNNMQQDIPLASVLTSMLCGLTEEELSEVKSAYKDQQFYKAVMQYAQEGKDQGIIRKLQRFMDQIEQFRRLIPYTPIHELLWRILEDTGYGDYMAAMPGGEQRKANIDMLTEKAMAFESTSYKGLFHFIRYIEQLKKYDVDYGEASLEDEQSDTVRIMSIHKSKGLEFPVVITVGMGKRFNQQDAKGSVLVHSDLGVGLDAVDLEKRTKSPSFLKKVIQREEILEGLGEELRVLYVAFTRAKEKLIITGTVKDPEAKLASYEMIRRQAQKALSFGRLARVSTYWDWILPALVRRTKDSSIEVSKIDASDLAKEERKEEVSAAFTLEALKNWDTVQVYDEEMHVRLKEQFTYQYPFENMEGRKLKFTVSELKKREYMEEESGELLFGEPEVIPLLPKFMQEEAEFTGASRGSAYHRVLELLDFTRNYDLDTMKEALGEMTESNRIDHEIAGCIDAEDILAFTSAPAGQRMKDAAKKGCLYKEQPFVLGVDMNLVYPDVTGDETVLVQGIIDVYFEEDGELVVLDYKTDKISSKGQLIEKYHSQLDYYARALEQLTGKRVKEKIIYSFTLREEIAV